MAAHEEESPLAGLVVTLADGRAFTADDWWDRIRGSSLWREYNDDITVEYLSRKQMHNLPDDNNVLYGYLDDGSEFLVNTCEIDNFQSLS